MKWGFWLWALWQKCLWRGGANSVYYINSAQALPAPLKKDEEQKVMEAILQGDETAREPLITHNLRLVVYIARKFDSPGASVEDLISIGTIGLIKAVNTFRPEKKIKLGTYAQDIVNYATENVVKFITGEKSLSEWDAYVAELNNMPVEDYIKINQDAYDRWKG